MRLDPPKYAKSHFGVRVFAGQPKSRNPGCQVRGDFGSPLGQTPASAAWVSLHARMRDRGEPCAKYQKYNAFIFSASPHSLTLRREGERPPDQGTRRAYHISVTGSAGRRLRVPATRRSPVSSRPIQTHLAAPAAGRCRRRHDVDAISFPLSAARCAPRLRGGNYTSFRDYVGAGGVRCSNEQLSHRQVIWPDASDAEDPVARPIRGRNSGGSPCQCTPETALARAPLR